MAGYSRCPLAGQRDVRSFAVYGVCGEDPWQRYVGPGVTVMSRSSGRCPAGLLHGCAPTARHRALVGLRGQRPASLHQPPGQRGCLAGAHLPGVRGPGKSHRLALPGLFGDGAGHPARAGHGPHPGRDPGGGDAVAGRPGHPRPDARRPARGCICDRPVRTRSGASSARRRPVARGGGLGAGCCAGRHDHGPVPGGGCHGEHAARAPSPEPCWRWRARV